MLLKNACRLATICFMGLAAFYSAWGAEMRPGTLREDALVYKDAKSTAEVLGRYRKGTALRFFVPGRDGYYATYLKNPVKGSNYAWIHGDKIEFQEGAPTTQSAQQSRSQRSSSRSSGDGGKWVALLGEFNMIGPSAVQAALGDTPTSGITPSFALEYGFPMGTSWVGSIRAGMLSYSKPVVSASDPAVVYKASSMVLMFNVGYVFVRRGKFIVSFDGGLGGAMSSAGNTSPATMSLSAQEISTSSIITIPMQAKLSARTSLSGDIGLILEAGLKINSLGSVPFIALPPVGTNQVSAAFALGGPFGAFGLAYRF